jgi:hypothetical protein
MVFDSDKLRPELLAYAASVANATASSIVPTVYIDQLDGTVYLSWMCMSWQIVFLKNKPSLLEIRNYYHNVNWHNDADPREYFLV